MRLGRSVKASWRARCWMRASAWRCSVISSWVETQPPSFIGWCCIRIVRLLSSWTFLPYSRREMTSRRQAIYSSLVPPVDMPSSNRCARISSSWLPGFSNSIGRL
ncbi:hypothetical protein D3C72_2022700 [compost metagenome]